MAKRRSGQTVFGRGVYVDKNTSQAARVEFVRQWLRVPHKAECALWGEEKAKNWRKAPKVFSPSSATGFSGGSDSILSNTGVYLSFAELFTTDIFLVLAIYPVLPTIMAVYRFLFQPALPLINISETKLESFGIKETVYYGHLMSHMTRDKQL